VLSPGSNSQMPVSWHFSQRSLSDFFFTASRLPPPADGIRASVGAP
jgi:hypothetical protein